MPAYLAVAGDKDWWPFPPPVAGVAQPAASGAAPGGPAAPARSAPAPEDSATELVGFVMALWRCLNGMRPR